MTNPSNSILKVDNLHVHYGAIHAVKGVSFEIPKGKILTLLGANGAGKSSCLRAISGMLKPSQGSINFEGMPIQGTRADLVASLKLIHAPEGRGIFANMTVYENLLLGAYFEKDSKKIEKDLEQAYSLFPRVKERRNQVAGTLSGGEQQMVAIARALMANPKLLLLDEPSLGLAPQIIERIFGTIEKINRELGTTVLLVEQNANLALQTAELAVVLETGSVVASGSAKELLQSDLIKKAYLGEG